MRLRLQVTAVLVLVLAVTLLGAWRLQRALLLDPLHAALTQERIAVAVHLAELAERAPDPRHRVGRVANDLNVDLSVVEAPPDRLRAPQTWDIDGRTVYVYPGPTSPVAVSFQRYNHAPQWLLVSFQADFERPQRRLGLGLLLLMSAATLLAAVVVRNLFRPLETATTAMRRVADGDLAHRVPEVGAVTDVAETFNTMATRVQELVDGQRNLMAAVSHELRTPLTRMRLQIELLTDTTADARRLDALQRDVEEMDSLVDELLESARLRQGVMALQYSEVDLSALISATLQEAPLAPRTVRVSESAGVVVGDATRLGRCLRNLWSNIVRYTPEAAEVTITTEEQGGCTRITVEDNGPGVPESELANLFSPFFRVEQSRNRATGGLGLGLMLVRQIAEAHGGSAAAEHRPGGGLRIRIVLPTDGPP